MVWRKSKPSNRFGRADPSGISTARIESAPVQFEGPQTPHDRITKTTGCYVFKSKSPTIMSRAAQGHTNAAIPRAILAGQVGFDLF